MKSHHSWQHEPQGHYTKWNKADRERQIPYDFTHMWNAKRKHKQKNKLYEQNKPHKDKQVDTANRAEVTEGKGGRGQNG